MMPVARQSLHLRAIERHAAWARDFAAAGDVEAATDEMRDIEALVAEMRSDHVDAESHD